MLLYSIDQYLYHLLSWLYPWFDSYEGLIIPNRDLKGSPVKQALCQYIYQYVLVIYHKRIKPA